MKKVLITMFLFAALISCETETPADKAKEAREICYEYLNSPAMKDYYNEPYLKGWDDAIKACGDNVSMLEDCQAKLLDKAADAEVAYNMKKLEEQTQ